MKFKTKAIVAFIIPLLSHLSAFTEKNYIIDLNISQDVTDSDIVSKEIHILDDRLWGDFNGLNLQISWCHVYYLIRDLDLDSNASNKLKLNFGNNHKSTKALLFNDYIDENNINIIHLGLTQQPYKILKNNFSVNQAVSLAKGTNTIMIFGVFEPTDEVSDDNTKLTFGIENPVFPSDSSYSLKLNVEYLIRIEDPNEILVNTGKQAVVLETTIGGKVSGNGVFPIGYSTSLFATPNKGYLFSKWTGEDESVSNPLSFQVKPSISKFKAIFIEDQNDDDGDGLSNYEELVSYNTDPNIKDSDEDGLEDQQEIEIGWDPNISDKNVLDTIMRIKGSTGDFISPYTEGWFYLPNRGWMWTNHSSYPYFYDAEDKDWMYFQSGNEKPKFYRYKTKTWLTIE